MAASFKELYDRDGYVLIADLTSAEEISELKVACEKVISATRSGTWKHRRVVGKQFPPFGDANPDSWGVQHVMHPDLGEPVFARWYASDSLIGATTELLGCSEDELQMELFNLLINPEHHEFALRWHRDDVRENATEEEEGEALRLWHHGVQWNTALYEDACLYIVPGSHMSPRTPKQRALSETLEPPKDPMEMPGAIQVVLQPGETVFYNSNILHCATYCPSQRRATLHACMGDVRGGTIRARNVLQHGLDWMKEPRFRETLPPGRARRMLDRVLVMANSAIGHVEYSQRS